MSERIILGLEIIRVFQIDREYQTNFNKITTIINVKNPVPQLFLDFNVFLLI
ncbi:hypothetical protein J3U16_00175 [Gilliamella sp. B3023]|uniref:hypothetical protein n=1 Tax=unclassified Gilliamella TaxID=2685620 RepID=UPI002269E52D|nr:MULTISPECIES: hypothetical protein [unclassified Gilliamella]MCX8586479.1 hypothetical protein [Gilliamella sp. B3562]MCX8673705.1 hypothetical protein [Gilliamella sp. B3023]MCX8686078.1 hypothetical protein [Gilliamella sp. B2864]